MSDEQRLRDGLESIAVPPSRVRIETVLPIARQRAFRRTAARTAAGAALAVGVLVGVPSVLLRPTAATTPVAPALQQPSSVPAPASPAACQVGELATPKGLTNVTADAVDPTGRYIVGNGTEGQDFRPVLWSDGVPKALPVIADSVQATAVNASGVVVGLLTRKNRDTVFRYENGRYTELKLPAGQWHPYPEPALNAAGDVVINAEPQGNTGGKGVIALLWRAGSVTSVRLPLPEGGHVQEVRDDGTLVGGIYKDGGADTAWVWNPNGKGTRLTVPSGRTGQGYAISGDWVTGGIWPPGSAALWNLRTGKLTEIEGDSDPGVAVNASGWMVTSTGRLVRSGEDAVLPATGSDQESLAQDVADTGLVVGTAVTRRDPVEEQKLREAGGVIPAEPQAPRVWQC
ncbi:hypothetical protein AB0C07_10065 [Actinoplanes missouriensis]|uniref:hypothetical protein n=1 Tax=Actinoplanes missouriensis TaxID=1866 RepID=UPI0033E651B7